MARNVDQTDLMKELSEGVLLDPLELAPKTDPLEVAPKRKTPEIKRMDEQFSTKAGGKGYAVTVRGDYYAPAAEQPGKKTKKPYEVVVNVEASTQRFRSSKTKY